MATTSTQSGAKGKGYVTGRKRMVMIPQEKSSGIRCKKSGVKNLSNLIIDTILLPGLQFARY
jgi:hypothetical protein